MPYSDGLIPPSVRSARSIRSPLVFRMTTFVVCFLEWGAEQLQHLPTTLMDAVASLRQPGTPDTGALREDSAIMGNDVEGSGDTIVGVRPPGRPCQPPQQSREPDGDRWCGADRSGGELEDRSQSTGTRMALDSRARRRNRPAGCGSVDGGGAGAGAGADMVNGDNRDIGRGDGRLLEGILGENRSEDRGEGHGSRRVSGGAGGAGAASTGYGIGDGTAIGILVV